MKYLKYFEEVDFDTKVTDPPELSMSKEKMSTYKKQLEEYNTKKKDVDKLYLNAKTDADLKTGTEKILGKFDPKNDIRNPFLIEYLNIAGLKRKMDLLQKQITTDKITKDNLTQQISLSSDEKTKTEITTKIKEIDTRTSTNSKNIQSLSNDINIAEKSIKEKMSKIEKEMKDYIGKISKEVKI
jgi:hypothetical protein